MHHAAEIHWVLEIADARAHRNDAGLAITARVEHLRRIVKVDA